MKKSYKIEQLKHMNKEELIEIIKSREMTIKVLEQLKEDKEAKKKQFDKKKSLKEVLVPYLNYARQIARLSRNDYKMPAEESIQEFLVLGQKVVERFNDL